jgi:ribosomal protein L11 methyltransferase
MKYFEVDFHITISEELMQDARDILSAMAGEAGFETFEETEEGLKGYVQQSLFEEDALQELTEAFPFENAHVSYEVREAPDEDWNAQWEEEGFEPIIVSRTPAEGESERNAPPAIIIHDGRHLPPSTLLSAPDGSLPSPLCIEIDARLAFGTGTHETTRMMVSTLLETDLKGKEVLDCGCGTGILGIAAMKLGACRCVAYDIDEWSADNARHNAVINQVDDGFASLLGDASVLEGVEGLFDVVMANINRNILLGDMPVFRSKMKPGAQLLLSGFYEEDIPLLTLKAESLGMRLVSQKSDGNWACLRFTLPAD